MTAFKKDLTFEWSTYTVIKGIGSASGLIYKDGLLYVISDDSDVLYIYQKATGQLDKVNLSPSGELLENRPKPKKSDLEAIAYDDHRFYMFGSGSTVQRNKLFIVSKNELQVKIESMTDLYQKIRTASGVDEADFNIEGAIIDEKDLFLFNRGNGPKRRNGIFVIRNWGIGNETFRYFPIPLPGIENSPFGFTDAILVGTEIYFLAAAERTDSTYEDGQILGSIIGEIDPKDFRLKWTRLISSTHKFEGLTLYQKEENEVHLLLCEDPDDGRTESEIFKLKIKR